MQRTLPITIGPSRSLTSGGVVALVGLLWIAGASWAVAQEPTPAGITDPAPFVPIEPPDAFDNSDDWVEIPAWEAPLAPIPQPVVCRPDLCPECQSPACGRGQDRLGACLGCGCCESFADRALHFPARAWHRGANRASQFDQVWEESFANSWVGERADLLAERTCPFRGKLDCLFVNWRLSSMYLEGCIPEGYDLFAFAETVPHWDSSPTPLSDTNPVEPGGSVDEARRIDGPRAKPITAVSLDVALPPGEKPRNKAREEFAQAGARAHLPGTHRIWNGSIYYWNASLLNHQPVYFEDVNLDQHGFTYGIWQPLVSGAKFFGTMPLLPYLLVAEPPQTTRYTLGESRPGSHAPYVHQRLPINADATAFEAVAVIGLIFLIP